MPDGPKIDAAKLEEDGFGPRPFYECFVAETRTMVDQLVGYVLFFYTYSTWEGRSVYMEDLYVTPSCRGQGLGTRLWQSVVKVIGYKKEDFSTYLRSAVLAIAIG